ncbi:MAG: hypothetical protein ACXVX9_00175 [Mycobacteriaceae bacterium]
MRNPLIPLTHRFPRLFGLEWVETEELFPTGDPNTVDLRPIRLLSGGFVPVGWTYDPEETK